MFICDECLKAIGPRVSPILDTVSREEAVTYTNRITVEDESGKTKKLVKTTTGFEIDYEFKLCPSCAGVTVHQQKVLDPSSIRAMHLSFVKGHLQSCKGENKKGDPCHTCIQIKARLRDLSPLALSAALEEAPMSQRLATIAEVAFANGRAAMWFAFKHSDDGNISHRAARNVGAASYYLKGYEPK